MGNSNTGTGENNTPDDAEDNEDPVEPTSEQDEREDGQVGPDEQAVTKTRRTVIIFRSPRMR